MKRCDPMHSWKCVSFPPPDPNTVYPSQFCLDDLPADIGGELNLYYYCITVNFSLFFLLIFVQYIQVFLRWVQKYLQEFHLDGLSSLPLCNALLYLVIGFVLKSICLIKVLLPQLSFPFAWNIFSYSFISTFCVSLELK